jgi:hypothetical protein
MGWPLSQDYNEAIQSPGLNFADPVLRRGEAFVNALGLPMPHSGNFADVYEVRCPDGTRWAVKCFTREVPGLHERYAEISTHLCRAKLPFTVDFTYLDQGIRVAGRWFPVLKMQWVEGLPLNQFVAQSADKPALLEGLSQVWARMGQHLRAAQVAHGDLQHGNVLLVREDVSWALRLLDYDGMWVPALAGRPSGEIGHPAYQHPWRAHTQTYAPEVDRFPLLLVATALRALMTGGRALWEKYDNGDNVLFRQEDLAAPSKSPLFYELLKLDDPAARFLTESLIDAARRPLGHTPSLDTVLPQVGLAGAPPQLPVAGRARPVALPVAGAAPPGGAARDHDPSAESALPSLRRYGRIAPQMGWLLAKPWMVGAMALIATLAVLVMTAVGVYLATRERPGGGEPDRAERSSGGGRQLGDRVVSTPPEPIGEARRRVADAWWERAQAAAGADRAQCQRRAYECYLFCLPGRDARDEAEIDKRLRALAEQVPGLAGPLDDLDLSEGQLMDDVVRLKPEQNLYSRRRYSGALVIDVVASADAGNIRVRGPRGSAVIFSWEQKPGEMRVTCPDGNEKPESGSVIARKPYPLAPHVRHHIQWWLAEGGMSVSVNGVIVLEELGWYDLSGRERVGVACAESPIVVQSFSVKRLK